MVPKNSSSMTSSVAFHWSEMFRLTLWSLVLAPLMGPPRFGIDCALRTDQIPDLRLILAFSTMTESEAVA